MSAATIMAAVIVIGIVALIAVAHEVFERLSGVERDIRAIHETAARANGEFWTLTQSLGLERQGPTYAPKKSRQ